MALRATDLGVAAGIKGETMITYLLFILGVIAYTAIEWAHWKVPGVAWSGYWKCHTACNIVNAILTFMVFLTWRGGVLGPVLALVGINSESPLLKLEIVPMLAMPAGCALSFVSSLLQQKLWPKKETP